MSETQQSIPPDADEMREIRENRKRIARFITIFVVTVLVLLTSYRYAIHTRLNDWYLFQAASHTSWVLGKIGESQLEPPHYGRYHAKEVRAAIAAWSRGEDLPGKEAIERMPGGPLTAWERWSYRALEARQQEKPRGNGPRVYFVWRPGLSTQIDAVMGKIYTIEDSLDLTAEERERQVEPLREELSALRKRQQEARTSPDSPDNVDALTFPFILIPECGAIEIMAIFLAAVLAFPTLWRKRLIGLLAGIPIMYSVNIFRLTVLAVIGAMDTSLGRTWFNFAHEYVWQAIYIIFVVAVWLLWVEYVKRSWGLPAFCLKFLAFVVVLVVVWWLLLPYYGQVLLQVTGVSLKYLLGVPIESGRIEAGGLLNTGTTLIFSVEGHERRMHIALLATNVPPYIALVLATAGIAWKRRLRILGYGCGILCFFHAAFITVALRWQDALMQASEIPTAMVQFFLTLPFMLWIVFAYWDHIAKLGKNNKT